MSSGGVGTKHLTTSFLRGCVHRQCLHREARRDNVISFGDQLSTGDRFLGIDQVSGAEEAEIDRAAANSPQ